MFFDTVFDRGAVSGGLPVHPDVPVDRPEGGRDTDRTVGTVHPVVPAGGLRACNTSDLSGAGVQVDGVDQYLVDAESAVGREVDPAVVAPRRPERPGGDSIVGSVGFEKVNIPDALRDVIPVDAQLPFSRNAHHVRAFTVTEISLDGGNI